MSLTQSERELFEWLLENHVPDFFDFVVDCWENPSLQEEFRRQNYRTVLALAEKLREHGIILKEPFLYEEQIRAYLSNPFG